MTKQILVIDDEESIRFTFEAFLEEAGYQVQTAASAAEAKQLTGTASFDLIYLDIMLGRDSGLVLLKELREKFATTPVVMITGAPEVDTAAEAVRRGAYDYIPKPVHQETLLRVTKMALHHKEVIDQRENYRAHLDGIFRSVQDGILLLDRHGQILQANRTSQSILGLPGDFTGLTLDRLPEKLVGPLSDLSQAVLNSGEPVADQRWEMTDPTGRFRDLNLAAAPWFDGGGETRGVVITLRDETRLNALEKGLKKRQNFDHIIGRSQKIQDVFSLIENLAEVDTTVLICGESGTGKELVAEALHYRSARKDGPLIKVNCAALPENLLESELFGHIKGSFTGAMRDKIGRFQQADGGTIFLDEIGDVSPALQVRLLRVLQNKEIERVGSGSPTQVDVRIVAATHQNLQEKVRCGEFREDLYYRLRVVEIPLPALRERRDDIPLLVAHFVQSFNDRFGRQIQGVADDAMARMLAYDWPGNIRELENTIERAFVVCRQDVIGVENLPPELLDGPLSAAIVADIPGEGDEVDMIRAALEKSGWNKSRAARLLGMSRRTIYRKIDEYAILTPDEYSDV